MHVVGRSVAASCQLVMQCVYLMNWVNAHSHRAMMKSLLWLLCFDLDFDDLVAITVIVIIAVTGRETWPAGCCLRFMEGSCLSSVDRVFIPNLGPGCTHELRLSVTTPTELGTHSALWRLSTFAGVPFGGLAHVSLSRVEVNTLYDGVHKITFVAVLHGEQKLFQRSSFAVVELSGNQ